MKKVTILFACICLCAIQTKAQSILNLSEWATANKAEIVYQNNAYETGSYTLSDGSRISYLKKIGTMEQEQNNTEINRSSVEIYPNPSNGQFTIEITNNEHPITNYEVKIMNLLGQTVYQQTLNAKQETVNTQLPKGMYIYKMFNGGNQYAVGKVVVR